jgi:hypothetical protein
MKTVYRSVNRLKAGLVMAYRSKAAGAEPPDAWRQNVMRSVRMIGPLPKDAAVLFSFGRMVWRLAPAALFLMIILAVLIASIDNTLELQMAGNMIGEPVQTYVNYEAL